MIINWYKKGEDFLQPEDKIEKSYPGKLDNKLGHLLISNKRILFVSEKELFSHKQNITMNEPLEDVQISHKSRYKFDIDINESHHLFESTLVSANIVERALILIKYQKILYNMPKKNSF
jgi:hypothetical protein